MNPRWLSAMALAVVACSTRTPSQNDARRGDLQHRAASLASIEPIRLLPTKESKRASFGVSVALDGDTAIVGADHDEETSGGGSASIYIRTDAGWSLQQKLVPSDGARGKFGHRVAIHGDTAVVGAREDNGNAKGERSGSAYVFVRSGNTWSQLQKLVPSDGAAGHAFGYSLALQNDTLLVGAINDSTPLKSGSVYVYGRVANTWIERHKLRASDGGRNFGVSVAVDGDKAIIGSNGEPRGAAYVFVRYGNSWDQRQMLVPSNSDGGISFGTLVALHGNTAVVAGSGYPPDGGGETTAAHIFEAEPVGSRWTEKQILLVGEKPSGEPFGSWIALHGDSLLVGKNARDDHGDISPMTAAPTSSSAYLFGRKEGTWTQRRTWIAAFDPKVESDSDFGFSVALNGETAIVGAPGFCDSGAVHLLPLNCGGPFDCGVSKIEHCPSSTGDGGGGEHDAGGPVHTSDAGNDVHDGNGANSSGGGCALARAPARASAPIGGLVLLVLAGAFRRRRNRSRNGTDHDHQGEHS